MDYVTLKGIENRFGVKRQDIPVTIFKELVDNALDHVETLALTVIVIMISSLRFMFRFPGMDMELPYKYQIQI